MWLWLRAPFEYGWSTHTRSSWSARRLHSTLWMSLRNPMLLYRCRVCGSYGPLRCGQCESEKRPERLCAKCAHFIEDELSAYCPDHLPHCNCRDGCSRPATFRCSRCHKLFGEHVRRQNPRNPEVDYCQRCHQLLFEQCVVCTAAGQIESRQVQVRLQNPLGRGGLWFTPVLGSQLSMEDLGTSQSGGDTLRATPTTTERVRTC